MADIVEDEGPPVTQKQLGLLLQDIAKNMEAMFHRLDSQRLNLSQALAIKEHGKDVVAAACRKAGDKLGTFADFDHPYDALVHAYLDSKL